MRPPNVVVATLLWAAALLVPLAAPMGAQEEAAAQARAGAWLDLVDEGRYRDSWDEAARAFRGAVTQDRWQQMLEAVRLPLGKVGSRDLKSRTFATSLPGAPDGRYVVVQYDTSFENKKGAVETVTMAQEEDGAWRLAGYFIR